MGSLGTVARGLKLWVSIALVVGWNLLCGVAIHLNGGTGRIESASAAWFASLACVAMATFALAVALSSAWRRVVLREEADVEGVVSAMWFVASITGLLGIVGVFSAAALS